MLRHPSHDALWFISELTSRIVAQTGIPADRFHLGKIILQSFKDAPDFIMQIDGATGEKETFKSALERSIRCAVAMRNFGIKTNDVIALMGPNCLDLPITIYAGFYLGVVVSTYNMSYMIKQFQDSFAQCPPKIVFCTRASATIVQKSLETNNIKALIITFDETDNFMSFQEFLRKYSDENEAKIFKPNDFNPSETFAIITSTSGTTGMPKFAPLTHAHLLYGLPSFILHFDKYPTPTRLGLCMSPVQWLSSHVMFILSPMTRFTRLQTSMPVTVEHVCQLIKVYKPSYTIINPTFMLNLLNSGKIYHSELMCFDDIFVGGSAIPTKLLDTLKRTLPSTCIYKGFGMTEVSSITFSGNDDVGTSYGRPLGHLKYRLVDTETELDILVANQIGELWIKGPSVFKGYYNKPETNADIFSGEWLKTGDLFYRDEHDNYYFVDRIKMLLKYKSHHISPTEIENIIIKLPMVSDVAVTGIPDAESGELPVACVVPRKGCNVTAQEVKDIVKNELSDAKQLRGGVVFLRDLPVTPSSKVDRRALRELVQTVKRF